MVQDGYCLVWSSSNGKHGWQQIDLGMEKRIGNPFQVGTGRDLVEPKWGRTLQVFRSSSMQNLEELMTFEKKKEEQSEGLRR